MRAEVRVDRARDFARCFELRNVTHAGQYEER
jgi:hypothetical protein